MSKKAKASQSSKAKSSKPIAKAAAKGKPAAAAAPAKTKTAKRSAPAKPQPQATAEGYFISLVPLGFEIHRGRPADTMQEKAIETFEQAKELALDHLLAMIEEAEHRLHALRRAATFEDYRSLH